MKKNYEELELKVILFPAEDVITASTADGGDNCDKLGCVDGVGCYTKN